MSIYRRDRRQAGGILIMTLVFVTMFTVIFIALSGLTNRQFHEGTHQVQEELAFQIAESGLNYARWRLAHDPDDFSEIEKDVSDQFAGVLGTYDVTFEQPTDLGGSIITITSVGHSSDAPNKTVTLQARYGIQSLARYVAITNSDVWYDGEELKGYIHSNGGIRMDAQTDNLMTSAKETYTCMPAHGCNYVTKPGIWGTGGKTELWEFPRPAVDYNSLTVDLIAIRDQAQSANTYYGPSGSFGYSVVFNSNNTYSVYKVTQKTGSINSWTSETGWEYSSYDISKQTLIETKAVPAGGVLFFEDDVWVKGDIRNRITVAAGRFPDQPSTNASVIINGNITYGGVKDGTRVFGAIAQKDILIPYSGIPTDLTIEGAYIAQKGRFGRRYYSSGSYRLRDSLNQYGMTASNLIPVTAWVDGGGNVVSGFQTGNTEYDPKLLYQPPPMFPTSGQYEFLSWEQIE